MVKSYIQETKASFHDAGSALADCSGCLTEFAPIEQFPYAASAKVPVT